MFNISAEAWLTSVLLPGLALGMLYFLIASGLSLIFGLMDVLNFAHGSLFMLGAYVAWTIVTYTNPETPSTGASRSPAAICASSPGCWVRRCWLVVSARC
jgi:branched-subunit amino acid ABC-type transport system permease component